MPRKPRQQRSRGTVDRLVEAGFVALAQHGPEGTTTRHIAAIAGVGVGSLYEYFSDKDAIFDAMTQKLIEDAMETGRRIRPVIASLEIEPAIRQVLETFRDLLERDGRRYLVCARYSLETGGPARLRPLENVLLDVLMQYVLRRPELLRAPGIGATAWLIVVSGVQTVVRFLSDPDPPISFEEMADGLARMIARFVEAERLRVS